MTQSLCCEYLTPMLALAAECNVNGQARAESVKQQRVKGGGKAAISWAGN